MLQSLVFIPALPYLLAYICCLMGTVTASRYDYGFDAYGEFQKRQDTQKTIVRGIPVSNGPVPVRREIRELEADPDAWSLYVLALSWMQYTPQNNSLSYYQIAGIHGAPGSTWAGVEPIAGNEHLGYCQHVSILFPTWHRPYLALYEQILYDLAQHISSLYPEPHREHFQEVARSFRVPYFDWAVVPLEGEGVLPSSAAFPHINVSGPNGVQNITNPMFSYIFRPLDGSIFPGNPWSSWSETKRAPYPDNSTGAVSNNSAVARSLDVHLQTHQQRLYNLFASYGNYVNFSNEGWIPGDRVGLYDSLESLHDNIHLIAGGRLGHFSIIPFSAFDPLFFLHHVSCDRIFAMWQQIYNESYVVPAPAIYPSHTMMAGDVQNEDTPLTPFYFNDTSFWTSAMVRDCETFGYTYADIANKSREDLIGTINRLYTNFSPATMLKRGSEYRPRVELVKADTVTHPVQSQDLDRLAHVAEKVLSEGNRYWEWIVNVHVNKMAFAEPFKIHLFIGESAKTPSRWLEAPNLAGTLGVSTTRMHYGKATSGLIGGTIPLTSALLDMIALGHLGSIRPSDVEPFLMSHLTVGVVRLDGTVQAIDEVDGLRVSIMSARVKAPASENMLAEWGDRKWHFDL